ncbi:SLC13 family permease [Candidatus Lokiarchaeum ossiferum]|uniref:SLC13 family permease n=1 Tax=Candidatus Lokiarchaeum ossiferum TaxID=2951803 RepID=UPI00352CAFCC
MWLSTLIISLCFLAVIVLLVLEKGNRVILAISGALICYLSLVFIEKETDFTLFVGFLFGSKEDGFVNIHSLLLIFGMSFIIQIVNKAGVFKFLAFKLVLLVADKPKYLLFIMCSITMILSAILNNILTVMIIIPLTITISRILNIDPEPFIISQAILVNIGGTLFSISSIPNILIATTAGISFNEFFLNVGIISIAVFFFIVGLFYLIYEKKIIIPAENIKILKEFNPWNFVADKKLLFKSSIVLIIVIISFMAIPSTVLAPDIISLIGAMVLAVISKLDQEKLLQSIDIEIIMYLLGVFVIAGSLEYTGILNYVGTFIGAIGQGNSFFTIILILWTSAILSSTIDNIPITKVLIPVVGQIGAQNSLIIQNKMYYALSFGANWGDNLTPMGDNILVMNLAAKNKRPLRMKEFWKIGFITTIFQLYLLTSYYVLFMNIFISILMFILLTVFIFLAYLRVYNPKLFLKINIFKKKQKNEVK